MLNRTKNDRLNLIGWGMILLLAVATGMLIRTLTAKYIGETPGLAAENDTRDDNGVVEEAEIQNPAPTISNEVDVTYSYLSPQDGPWIQTQNNIEVTVSNLRQVGSELKADVCFDMPDDSDWMLWYISTVDFGGAKGIGFGGDRISYEEATETQSGYRCDTVHFGVPNGAGFSKITMTLYIAAPPREGHECDFYQNQAQTKLKADGYDIQISCSYSDSGAVVTIDKKPDGMSQEEAEQLVFGPEAKALSIPWVFTFSQ